MTEPSDTPRENADASEPPRDHYDEDGTYVGPPELIEPEDDGPVDMGLEPDPVTARNPDPAAASEYERNAQLARDYGITNA